MRRPLLRLASSAAIAAALLMSGCSSSDGITPVEPADINSLLPSSRPTAHSPELPADSPGPMEIGDYLVAGWAAMTLAEINDALGVDALEDTLDDASLVAALFLWESANVYETRNVSLLAALSGDECGWCAEHRTLIMDSAGQNLRITGGDYLLDLADGRAGRTEYGSVVVEIPASREETVVWNTDGTAQQRRPAGEPLMRLELVYRDDQWFVVGVAED